MNELSCTQILHMTEKYHAIGCNDQYHASLSHRNEIDDFKALWNILDCIVKVASLGVDPQNDIVHLGALRGEKELLAEGGGAAEFAGEDFELHPLELRLLENEVGDGGDCKVVLVGAGRSHLTVADGRSADRTASLSARLRL